MKKITVFFWLILLLISFNSCDKKKIDKLHGAWLLESYNNRGNLTIEFIFDCDDIFYLAESRSSENYTGCDTFKYDYVKGTFQVNGKDLILQGNYYTDSTFSALKPPGCGTPEIYKFNKLLEWGKKDQFILYYKTQKAYYKRLTTKDCD